jgi:hypothetical protein
VAVEKAQVAAEKVHEVAHAAKEVTKDKAKEAAHVVKETGREWVPGQETAAVGVRVFGLVLFKGVPRYGKGGMAKGSQRSYCQ